jgi:hypothetical protein
MDCGRSNPIVNARLEHPNTGVVTTSRMRWKFARRINKAAVRLSDLHLTFPRVGQPFDMRVSPIRWPIAGAIAVLVSACHATPASVGPNKPSGFVVRAGDARIYRSFNQKADGSFRATDVRVPPSTRLIAYHLYCRHPGGRVTVALSGLSGASSACTTDGASGHVFFDLDNETLIWARYTISVDAPRGADWSLAIDASPHGLRSFG